MILDSSYDKFKYTLFRPDDGVNGGAVTDRSVTVTVYYQAV